jgi:hypothetical protein
MLCHPWLDYDRQTMPDPAMGEIMTDFTDEPYDNPHVPDGSTDPRLGGWSAFPAAPWVPFEQPAPLPIELPPGEVIGFTKRYREDGPAYSFVAIRVAPLGWYLTGPNYAGQPIDWETLLEFIGGPDDWAKVGRVTRWSPLLGEYA